jgi:hypothetical protein
MNGEHEARLPYGDARDQNLQNMSGKPRRYGLAILLASFTPAPIAAVIQHNIEFPDNGLFLLALILFSGLLSPIYLANLSQQGQNRTQRVAAVIGAAVYSAIVLFFSTATILFS